jgi:tRNA modification GTPase
LFCMWRILPAFPRCIPTVLTYARCVSQLSHGISTVVPSDAQRQTIYALSTPPGKAGVAVVRVSGPNALLVWEKMARTTKKTRSPTPWKMERCRLVQPDDDSHQIDDGLAVYFKGEISH